MALLMFSADSVGTQLYWRQKKGSSQERKALSEDKREMIEEEREGAKKEKGTSLAHEGRKESGPVGRESAGAHSRDNMPRFLRSSITPSNKTLKGTFVRVILQWRKVPDIRLNLIRP